MSIVFKLGALSVRNAEEVLGEKAKWDGAKQRFHPNTEGDALDIVWRGGGFPHNTVSGETGEYVAFPFDVSKTAEKNIRDVLQRDQSLTFPDTDAWWPLIAGGNNENTEALQGHYLMNPSNPPLEKREGHGDRRFPVLKYRTTHDHAIKEDGWYLTTIGATEDGYVLPTLNCLMFFKKKAPLSHWKQQVDLYQALTGRLYRMGRRNIKPELTDYGKKVLSRMDSRTVADREITQDGLSEAEGKIVEGLRGKVVSKKTFKMLVEFAARKTIGELRVIGPDTVASFQQDFSYSGSGGSAYYSTLYVWHRGQFMEESYQWRDAHSSSNDKPWLKISDINTERSSISDNQVTLHLVSRTETFGFDSPKWSTSKEDLAREVFKPIKEVPQSSSGSAKSRSLFWRIVDWLGNL